MIVAIDGPVGSGKSAVGKRVAQALGVPFVDSGLMYRAIACLARDREVDPGDGAALARLAAAARIVVDGPRVSIDGQDYTARVYGPEVSGVVSQIAKVAGVRLALVAQQRALGRPPGVVMAGRDIGTVVFPDTPHKFYLEASIAERVRRRAVQLEARGERADRAKMTVEVLERDRLDTGRSLAPLRPAADAVTVATDGLDVDGVVAQVLQRVRAAGPGSP